MATLKDIAKRANVSIGTVSRCLANDESLKISNETRNTIVDVAKELNYKPSQKKNSGLKFAIVNWYSNYEEITDPYYFYIRSAVEKEFIKQDIKFQNLFRGKLIGNLNGINGIIAIGKFSNSEIDQMLSFTNNIVFVDSSPNDEMFPSVVVDFKAATTKVIDYFLSLKLNKIGFIGGSEQTADHETKIVDQRAIYFKKIMQNKNLFNEQHFLLGEFTMNSGEELMYKMIEENEQLPDAIFCANDLIAIGVNRALYKKSTSINKSIKIIGFNNIPVSKFIVPSLSTVEVYQELMGIEAVKLGIENINKQQIVPKKIVVPVKLKIRRS